MRIVWNVLKRMIIVQLVWLENTLWNWNGSWSESAGQLEAKTLQGGGQDRDL